MRVADFDFALPVERIAQRPIEPRDAAKLLAVSSHALVDEIVGHLPDLLNPGDLLVFNDTKVIPARLIGRRGDARISVTLHQALSADEWRVFAKPAKRLRLGDTVTFSPDFTATVMERRVEGDVTLRFNQAGPALLQALHDYGAMPLPPYIRGGVADEQDQTDYQTIFAEREGAVAAPTASLHFTPDLLAGLATRGVETTRLTLHVGAGTFLPVKVEDTNDHVMHEEIGILSDETAATINRTHARGNRVVAIGTTSMRLIESAAAANGEVTAFSAATGIFITPGYRFKAVDRLLTNFHLPKSTLFMLVAAFSGLERMKQAYAHAIAGGYRFYSYGDCCLLDREDLV